MLKKGARFLKILSIVLIFTLFLAFLGSSPSIFEKQIEDAATLKHYAESLGLTTEEAIKDGGGKAFVATIVSTCAETFSGDTVDDYSRPTNTYLPKGTKDYCHPLKITDPVSKREYYKLASGYRIYADDDSAVISKESLPKENEISFSFSKIEGKKLFVGFKTGLKIPFKVVYNNQNYLSPNAPDYSVFASEFTSVDVIFYHTQSLDISNFDLPENPVFSKVTKLKSKNKNEVSLRFHLKEKGVFYGFDTKYNDSGELEFSFLMPPKLIKNNSEKGYSLEGIKVLIDPGHGGKDPGAPNVNDTKQYSEQNYALVYAKYLSENLRALGATVTFTRVSNTTVSLEDRFSIIRNANADLVISLHFNASESKKEKSGYFMGYFYPFAYTPAKFISDSIKKTNILPPENGGIDWHYFRLSRVSSCPVILTENGYIDSKTDYNKIRNQTLIKEYCSALTDGIFNYFLSISQMNCQTKCNTF